MGRHLKIIWKWGPLQAPSYFKLGQNKGPRNGICRDLGARFFCFDQFYLINHQIKKKQFQGRFYISEETTSLKQKIDGAVDEWSIIAEALVSFH